jgi:hypothetical protein
MTAHAKRNKRDHPEEGPRTAVAAREHEASPLQRLIRRRLRERDSSYGEVARRGRLPRSTVYTLATTAGPGPAAAPGHGRRAGRGPGRAGLRGPRRGDRVDRAVLLRAGPGRAAGPGRPEAELLAASIDELTPEDRRHVAALVESLRNRPRRSRRAASTAPGPLAPIFTQRISPQSEIRPPGSERYGRPGRHGDRIHHVRDRRPTALPLLTRHQEPHGQEHFATLPAHEGTRGVIRNTGEQSALHPPLLSRPPRGS